MRVSQGHISPIGKQRIVAQISPQIFQQDHVADQAVGDLVMPS